MCVLNKTYRRPIVGVMVCVCKCVCVRVEQDIQETNSRCNGVLYSADISKSICVRMNASVYAWEVKIRNTDRRRHTKHHTHTRRLVWARFLARIRREEKSRYRERVCVCVCERVCV